MPTENVDDIYSLRSIIVIEYTSINKWLDTFMLKCTSTEVVIAVLYKKKGLRANRNPKNIAINRGMTPSPKGPLLLYSNISFQALGISPFKNAISPDIGNKNNDPAIKWSSIVDSKSKPRQSLS